MGSGNEGLAQIERAANELRARGEPIVPSTLAREKVTNPSRSYAAEQGIIYSANKYLCARIVRPAQVFAATREWKNRS